MRHRECLGAGEVTTTTTLLCQHHEYAISCHFPYYFTLYISDNTAKKSELKTKKVGTCQDDDFFALLSSYGAF